MNSASERSDIAKKKTAMVCSIEETLPSTQTYRKEE
jgi:hypothetical protein